MAPCQVARYAGDVNEERARFIKATFARAFNAAVKGPHRCLFPDCKGIAIASHSRQRGSELQAIAKHGHVYGLTIDFPSAIGNYSPTIFTRQGIRKATTFPGFCATHDRELFREIDVGTLAPSEIGAATYALRAIAHEAKRKLIMLLCSVACSREKYRRVVHVRDLTAVQAPRD